MANYRRRRKRPFNLRPVRVTKSIPIGALDTLDVTSGALLNASTTPYRLITADLSFNISDLAALIDDGQEFGIAHGDYTAAEIEECLEAQSAIDVGDQVQNEFANRRVRTIGFMVGAPGTDASKTFNDGKSIKIKLNWLISVGKFISVWVRNGSDTIYTTGSNMLVMGTVWVKDTM